MKIINLSKTVLSILLILTTSSVGESSLDGCRSSINKSNSSGCEIKNITTVEKKDIFRIKEEELIPAIIQTNISKDIKSVNVNHKGKELTVIRNIKDIKKSCPPFCIMPMSIDGVKTVGELETLEFIKNLDKKSNRLILDVRDNKYYKSGTIPSSLNLPSHMLQEDSKYFKDVIAVLGIKKVNGNWQFKEIHNLLIFDDGLTDNKAFKVINTLLNLSYPSDKIFYYRGGFSSWKSLGLTHY